MSFFDEDDDEPTRRAPRPRRAAAPAGRPPTPTSQDLLVRRAMAAGIAVLLFIFLVVVVRACQTSQRKNALRDWNTQATQIVSQSDSSVVGRLFETLSGAQNGTTTPQQVQTSVAQLRAAADKNLQTAKDLDTPGQLEGAQLSLLTALELRRETLGFVAQRVTTAMGSQGNAANQAVVAIAGSMQAILASDTLIRLRVTPLATQELRDNDVVADPVRTSGSLPGLDWLQPAYVAAQLGTRLSGQTRQRNETPAPGTHGNGLDATSYNGTDLTPGADGVNKPSVGSEAVFTVSISNSGENDEVDVPVTVTLQGGRAKDIVGKATLGAIATGASESVEVRLRQLPQAGVVYNVNVDVGAVPGEENTDNNKATYNVLFQ